MDKSLIEKLKDAKKDHEVALVNFFNDGTVNSDEYYFAKTANTIGRLENEFTLDVLSRATSSYARTLDFDTIDMQMLMGLVYKKEDVEENNVIKENAKPLKNIVRFYTGKIDSYLDGEKTNVSNYYDYGIGRQGYLYYNDFVKYAKRAGLSYVGPETFEEFKNKVLSGEIFDIYVSADLREKEDNMKLVRKL